MNEKKFNDMVDNERRLMLELKELKEENEKELKETYQRMDQEKEMYKQKVQEAENKMRVRF